MLSVMGNNSNHEIHQAYRVWTNRMADSSVLNCPLDRTSKNLRAGNTSQRCEKINFLFTIYCFCMSLSQEHACVGNEAYVFDPKLLNSTWTGNTNRG